MLILNVTRNVDGQYEVTDQRGKLVDGPFETNAAAWRAIDRLDNEAATLKRRSNKRVVWGTPEAPARGKKARRKEKQLSEKQAERDEHRLKVNAAKAPGWVRGVASAKFDPVGQRAYRDHKLGTFGAASEVKRIDPAEYLAAQARGER